MTLGRSRDVKPHAFLNWRQVEKKRHRAFCAMLEPLSALEVLVDAVLKGCRSQHVALGGHRRRLTAWPLLMF